MAALGIPAAVLEHQHRAVARRDLRTVGRDKPHAHGVVVHPDAEGIALDGEPFRFGRRLSVDSSKIVEVIDPLLRQLHESGADAGDIRGFLDAE